MPDAPAILLIVVANLLLGALVWRWLEWSVANVPRSGSDAALAPDMLERAFAALSLGIGITGWLALLLAECGWYSLSRLALLLALLTLVAAYFGRATPPEPRPARRWHPTSLILLAWLPLAAWLFFRPHEYILGGADAGVYVSLGANIDRSGGILIDDPLLARLDPALYPVLLRALPPPEAAPYYWFPGFYVPGAPAGRVVPQFYPLHPVWFALADGVGGISASLLLPGLWAALSVIALFLLARRIGGAWAALLLLGGMSLSGLQIWFSRYPTTETLTQFLLWAGVWALGMWWTDRSRRAWGLLAGLLWGEMMLTRIDMFFVWSVPLLLLGWLWLRRELRRRDGWYFLPLFLLTLHSFAHAWWQSRPYFLNTFGLGLNLLRRFAIVPVAALFLLVLLAVLFRRYPRRALAAHWMRWQRPAVIVAMAVILLLAAYAWFVRPYGQAGVRVWNNWFAAEQVTVADRENLQRLGWYLSPLGVWLGVMGSCWLLWRWQRGRRLEMGATLFVGLFFSLLYLWRLQNNPILIYGLRRYVPAVMPFAILAGAGLLAWLPARRQKWARVGGIALVLLWLGGLAWGARGLVRQVDARGLVAQLDAAANELPAASVLLFNDPAPVGLGDFMGMPLQFLHQRYAFTLHDVAQLARGDLAARLQGAIRGWQAEGYAVYWVGDPAWLTEQGVSFSPAADITLRAGTLEGSRDHRPRQILAREWALTLYEIEP